MNAYFIRVFKINEKDETVIIQEITYIFPAKEIYVTTDMFRGYEKNTELWKEYSFLLQNNV